MATGLPRPYGAGLPGLSGAVPHALPDLGSTSPAPRSGRWAITASRSRNGRARSGRGADSKGSPRCERETRDHRRAPPCAARSRSRHSHAILHGVAPCRGTWFHEASLFRGGIRGAKTSLVEGPSLAVLPPRMHCRGTPKPRERQGNRVWERMSAGVGPGLQSRCGLIGAPMASSAVRTQVGRKERFRADGDGVIGVSVYRSRVGFAPRRCNVLPPVATPIRNTSRAPADRRQPAR